MMDKLPEDEGGLLTDEEIKAKYRELWEELDTEDTVLEEDEAALGVMRKMLKAQRDLTASTILRKFRQAIRDGRAGNELGLTNEEFEVFCSIENEGIAKTASMIKYPPNPYGDRLAHELWLAFNEAIQATKELNKEK